jgi:hypothetical protein
LLLKKWKNRLKDRVGTLLKNHLQGLEIQGNLWLEFKLPHQIWKPKITKKLRFQGYSKLLNRNLNFIFNQWASSNLNLLLYLKRIIRKSHCSLSAKALHLNSQSELSFKIQFYKMKKMICSILHNLEKKCRNRQWTHIERLCQKLLRFQVLQNKFKEQKWIHLTQVTQELEEETLQLQKPHSRNMIRVRIEVPNMTKISITVKRLLKISRNLSDRL